MLEKSNESAKKGQNLSHEPVPLFAFCRDCSTDKPLSAFSSHRLTRDLKRGTCKACNNGYMKARRNPEAAPTILTKKPRQASLSLSETLAVLHKLIPLTITITENVALVAQTLPSAQRDLLHSQLGELRATYDKLSGRAVPEIAADSAQKAAARAAVESLLASRPSSSTAPQASPKAENRPQRSDMPPSEVVASPKPSPKPSAQPEAEPTEQPSPPSPTIPNLSDTFSPEYLAKQAALNKKDSLDNF